MKQFSFFVIDGTKLKQQKISKIFPLFRYGL